MRENDKELMNKMLIASRRLEQACLTDFVDTRQLCYFILLSMCFLIRSKIFFKSTFFTVVILFQHS